MIAVYGAGSVGLQIGARLARAGVPVLFVVRRPEVALRIARDGVESEDPARGESFRVRVPAVCGAAQAAERLEGGPVLFCMRGTDVEAAADALRAVAPDPSALPVVSFQNDVHNEEKLALRFPRVVGGVVRQTCTRTGPNATRAVGPGRLVLGAHPEGPGPDAERLAAALRRAGYDVGLSRRIAEDKWLKLCINLMSAPNALVRREDHTGRAFVEIKARLLEEARDATSAAGISARCCDGRDRSLEAEIAHQRASLERGTSARQLPVYNQVWTALRHGGPLEADLYHRRILDLAARAGTSAPLNERMLAALLRAYREGRGPESARASEILGPEGAA